MVDFPKESFPLTGLEEFVFNDELKLLERKHVAFLERYKGSVTDDLLYNLLDVVVAAAARGGGFIQNINDEILPFYEQIIKTNAEREAEAEEEAKIGFTKAEFNYYLLEIQQGLGNRILKFSKPYTKKIEIIGDLIPKKPGNEDYITTDHFESFLAYFGEDIPEPVQGDSDFEDFQTFKDIIKIEGSLKHVKVLKGIIINLVDILNIQESNTLYNFKLWFFKNNSVREGLTGTKAFENTVWYTNHIAKLEEFLENLISIRLEYLDSVRDSQGRSQSGTNFGELYYLPLIDPKS